MPQTGEELLHYALPGLVSAQEGTSPQAGYTVPYLITYCFNLVSLAFLGGLVPLWLARHAAPGGIVP